MRELTNLTEGISAFLREHCPNAQSQFESILTDMSENAAERRSHLLTSTRRLVNSLADGLSPPQNVPGLERDKPINRLQFFLEKAIEASNVDMDKKNLESMLRLVYDRANKGVHANASKFEVQQSVLQILIYLNALKTVAPFSQKG